MDISRFKKTIAGISTAAIALTQASAVFAYSDVPAGVWYGDAVDAFVSAGYLDSSQARFRGGETANRAEFVKLVVELNGGILSTPPAVPSFSDVAPGAWYYGYFEEAGKEGWVRGDGDCYGSLPCYARAGANINRAEAAALIVRSFGLGYSGAAAQFVDNPTGQWYTDVIQTAADHCVLQGDDSTGRVRPGDNMNRAEMVVMLHRVDQGLTYGVDCGGGVSGEPMLTDVIPTSALTLEAEFNTALDADSAEDAGAYTVSCGTSDLAVDSAELVDVDIVEVSLGEATDPNEDCTLTVSDVATEAGGMINDSLAFSGFSPTPLGEGTLEVSLSASNPVGDTIPAGAVGVVMLSSDLTASCDDSVVIEDMTILHEGFGDEAEIDGVYAAIDGARVTRKRTIDSEDQTAELRFSSPLVIDPCETVTVDVVVDMAAGATASAEHNLVLELASDIVSNAQEVAGNFPVRGNTFRTAAVAGGTVTVEYRTVTPDEVEVGDVGVVIGKFEVSVDSVEDQTFYSMTMEQNSSASDGDFANLAVRRTDGTVLTNTVATSVGDFVTLVFDPPFTVLEGDKITLEVIGDIIGGAGDSIILHFEETSDLFSVGSLYGYGVNGQLYGSQVAIDGDPAASTINIDAGEFRIGIDGPPTQDYTRDDNDAILANIEFETGGEKIDVKTLYMAIQGQSSSGRYLCGGGVSGNGSSPTITANCATGTDDTIVEVLEDVEIRNVETGRTIDGVSVAGGHSTTGTATGTYHIYRFDDFVVHGDEMWELRVDYIDNGAGKHPASGDKFRAHICGEPTNILVNGSLTDNSSTCDFGGMIAGVETYQMEVEGLSTGDKVGDVRPRGNIAGNFHRIANATLTVAVKGLNATDTSVENANDINLLRFEARAGEAEDILLTKAVFEEAATTANLQNIQNYTLWVDTDADSQVDTILEDGVANQGNTVTFADLAGGGFVVPAEETVIFELHGDVSSSLTSTSVQIEFADTNSAGTYLEAEELDDGSSLSGISTNTTCSNGSNCDIIVTTQASTNWSLVNQGDLYVTQDSTPIRSRQLLGGTLADEVLRLEFHAENEDIDVTDLQITSSGGNANSVDSLELYIDGASDPFATASIGGCGNDSVYPTGATFCANMENRQLVVPEGQDVDVLIRPRMKADTSGGTGNDLVQFFISPIPAADDATGTGAVRGRGDLSSNDLAANNEDTTAAGEIFIGTENAGPNVIILGNQNRAVMSKIVSITNASPDANGSSVPSGVNAIGQFLFTAADHNNSNDGLNDVVIDGIIFNVTASDVQFNASTGTGFQIYNKANSSVKEPCTAYETDGTAINGTYAGSLLVQCDGLIAATVNTEIDEGSSVTLVLQGNVTDTNTGTSNSDLQVSLQSFDSIGNTTFGVPGVGDSHILWRDKDGANSYQFTWIEFPETTVNSTTYNS